MDTFSLQDEGNKRTFGFKALFIEIGAILSLVVILLFVLSYFKIINFSLFFPSQSSKSEQITSISPTQKAQQISNPSPAQNINQVAVLKKNNALHFSTINVEFEGIIKSINTNGDKVVGSDGKDYFFKIIILLSVGNSGDTVPVYYPEEQVSKISIFLKTGNNKPMPINISDLKVGDKIIVNHMINTLKKIPDELISSAITKIQ